MHFFFWYELLPTDSRVKFVLYAEMWYEALIYVLCILVATCLIGPPTYGPTYVVQVKRGYILCCCSFSPKEYVKCLTGT